MKDVTIIIPVYTLQLRPVERLALRRTFDVMGGRDCAFVVPRSLSESGLHALMARVTEGLPSVGYRVETFDGAYFAGREGYNRLMTSTELYRRFADARWVCVVQTDVLLLRDDLDVWLDSPYDYVGAPWLPDAREVCGFYPLHRLEWALRRLWARLIPGFHSINLKYCVGNGGFSLRRVSKFARLAEAFAQRFAQANAHADRTENFEDVLWSVMVNRWQPGALNVAPWQEALRFSWESHPDYASRLTQGSLPMGAHAFYRKRNRRFWQNKIKALQANTP